MAANQFPIYVKGPHVEVGAIGSTANLLYDGTGYLDDVFTGAADGSMCDTIFVWPQGTVPACKLTVFYYDSTITKFIGDIPYDGSTIDPLIENGPMIDVLALIGFPDGIPLKSGHKIKMGSTVIASPGYFSRIASGGDF